MNKEVFFREIEKALSKVSSTEREEILYDYKEHFLIGKENGKTEEEICLELGDPKEIADNYLSNHIPEEIEFAPKDEVKENNEVSTNNNKRNSYTVFAIVTGILLAAIISIAVLQKHNNSALNVNKDGIQVGGITIDSSGIHGDNISIDSNGFKVPGVTIDDKGMKAPGVNIDSNGVKLPGVTIDDKGVKAPGVNIDSNGVNMPGVSIDENGVKVDIPGVKVDIKK